MEQRRQFTPFSLSETIPYQYGITDGGWTTPAEKTLCKDEYDPCPLNFQSLYHL